MLTENTILRFKSYYGIKRRLVRWKTIFIYIYIYIKLLILAAVTRQPLNTQKTEKIQVRIAVNCTEWELAIAI
jgi:hypothetical protein